mgnify:CR=1 FL=1
MSLTRQGLGGAECAHRKVFSLVNTHLLCRMKLRVVAVACEITHERKTVCSKSASGIRARVLLQSWGSRKIDVK